MVRVELCITRSGFYVADTVPDLRAIESRTKVAASQINRHEGARRKEGEKKKLEETRRKETWNVEEDDAMPAGDEDAFHSAESERRADEAGGCVSELFSDRPRYRRRIFLDDALSCFG